MHPIYLDYNASTPIDPVILNALTAELKEEIGNPSSIHAHGRKCKNKLDLCRKSIARFFNVRPQEIIFTSGGTEGAALLIQGVCGMKNQGHILTSNTEHACIYQTLKEMEKKDFSISYLPSGEAGAVSPEEIEKGIREDTILISLMAVNNETGIKTDIEGIAKIAESRNIPFIVDGVAWLGKEEFKIPSGVSAIFFSGHKIHAPKGIGVCVCRTSLKLSPLFRGGEQEQNRRAGTENLPGIFALAKAISILEQKQQSHIIHMATMRDLLESELTKNLPNVVVNGLGPRICNTLNLAFLGVDGEELLMNLDLEGISVSHGSACSSGALEPSRILLSMGLPIARVNSSIRFSVGRTTTLEEINVAADIIVKTVKRLQKIT